MQTRMISHRAVSAVGLGAMPLSSESPPPRDRAIATIHAALDAGVRLIDTADAYSPTGDVGHNEEIIAEALRTWGGDRDDVLVATKGGHTRTRDGGWGKDGSPEHLRRACEASLARLRVESIGLYQLHRPDPKVPYAESVGALAQLLDEGKIQLAGVSNADPGQIREAMGIVALASVQNEFSPRFRSSQRELDLCAQLGVAFLPWSPLGGMGNAQALGRSHTAFAEVAEERGISPQQVALAWMMAKEPVVIPIPGSSRPETARASAAAADIQLSPEEMARLDQR